MVMGRTVIRAGMMRHRVQLQTGVEAPDSYGERSLTWEGLGFYWAHVEPLRADEVVEGGRQLERVTHRVTMRHAPEILAAENLRVVMTQKGGKTLEVDGIRNVEEADAKLELTCGERRKGARDG